jgi:sec-independent protein translocase protein TatA
MFGIGFSELIFILIVSVMLFGADKIPEIARTLGKGMAQLKNATEEIKSEINKSAQNHGIDIPGAQKTLESEIESAKQSFSKITDGVSQNSVVDEINEIKTTIDDLPEGPIKRS